MIKVLFFFVFLSTNLSAMMKQGLEGSDKPEKEPSSQAWMTEKRRTSIQEALTDALSEIEQPNSDSPPRLVKHRFKDEKMGSFRRIVFSLKNVDGIVFKTEIGTSFAQIVLQNTRAADAAVARHNLTRIIVPRVELFIVDGLKILAEEELEVKHSALAVVNEYNSYYARFDSEPRLKDNFLDLFKQLVVFLQTSKISDVKPDNFPLLKRNGIICIAVVDRDLADGNGIKQLFWGGNTSPSYIKPRAVSLLPPDLFVEIRQFAANLLGLSPTGFISNADLDFFIEHRARELKDYEFRQWGRANGKSGKKEIVVTPSVDELLSAQSKRQTLALIDIFNKKLQENEGRTMRLSFFSDVFQSLFSPEQVEEACSLLEPSMTILKQHNLIFDFKCEGDGILLRG